MASSIGQRKADHITLCATGDVGFRSTGPLFDQVRLIHDALPDLDADAIDTSVTLLGKKLRAPLVIAAMTGGTDEAGRINRELASLAEERGIAFGLGSQRAMHKRQGTAGTYRVRDVAPTTLVLGNVGVVQAREMTTAEVRALADEVGADALCVHLNPAMELVQPGGDRDFRGGVETLARLVKELGRPVVMKETGCGLSPAVVARARRAGVAHVDVSGAGGTSWVGVETLRAAEGGDARGRALGEALWDWGIPTAASVASLAPCGLDTVIATGGVSSGLDVAKALALGAHAAGIARPVLKALVAGGRAAAGEFLDGVMAELRAAMLLTGSADVAALRSAPRVLGGDLSLWLEVLSQRR
ncbi:MAG TPA: type 2 isopentenyl-diphosphate Delta-isomerase [Polyangiaceae bacterium]|jgi:isopentenyl-diphosphate delta-isomerase